MSEYVVKKDVFIKSPNSTKKILTRYTIVLSIFIIITLLMYLIFGYQESFANLLKNALVAVAFSLAFTAILKLIRRKNNSYFISSINNNIQIALIIGFICQNEIIYILLASLFISLIIKELYKGLGIASCLYGILLVLIYHYFTDQELILFDTIKDRDFYLESINLKFIKENIIGLNYLSPVLAIISFIYLFIKKSIKYGISIAYGLTFFGIILLYSVFKNMQIWFFLYVILTSNIMFYNVFVITDYRVSPITMEGQIIYGIILGILSSIGYFINPILGIIIPILLGPILFNNIINKISFKLKYKLKYYYMVITLLLIVSLGTLVGLFLLTS